MGKNKNNSGLGKALTNKIERKKNQSMGDRAPIFFQETQENQEEKKKAKMQSMVDQNSLTEFLQIAQISEQDFHANRDIKFKEIREEMRNKKVIANTSKRVFQVEEMVDQQLLANLQMPRRPNWQNLSKEALEKKQAEAYLNWRRSLAQVQQKNSEIKITPYEKNIEVWKQLWRVVDRSELIVQIVDGRDPLFFRSQDLVQYIEQVSPKKQSLLLINKSDLVTPEKTLMWSEYFNKQKINHVFFSAKQGTSKPEDEGLNQDEALSETTEESAENQNLYKFINSPQVLSVGQLIELMDMYAKQFNKEKIEIGMVGYPNVGKSSVINAVLGKKKVAVASMPGKTKHFQTLHLTEKVTLCDCPGLVFPRISSSYAEMVLNGLYSVDTLKSFNDPMEILAMRINKKQFNRHYSISWNVDEVYDGQSILEKYARMRGLFTGNGLPNLAISARNIIKDYVTGVLKYAKHPPGYQSESVIREEKQLLESVQEGEKQQKEEKDPKQQHEKYDAESNMKKKQAEKEKQIDGEFFGDEVQQAAMTYEETVKLLTEDDLLDIIQGRQIGGGVHITKEMRKNIKFAMKRGEEPEDIIKKVFLGSKDKFKNFVNPKYEK